MWHRIIPALVIALVIYFVWQEAQQGHLGVIPPAILEITSNTDAQVYVDGQLSGTIRASQMRILNNLKPGRHIIGLAALGFKSKSVGIAVENGQKLEQVFALEPEAVAAVPKTKTVAFDDLEKSINDADDGAVLFLAAGDYRLSSTISIQKSISLIGAGQTKTHVFSRAGTALMSFKNGELHLKGIDFVHTGKQKADVLDVKDAQIDIEDCRFAGGYTPDSPRKDGDGLWLHGRSSGKITKSRFERNVLNGLEVRDTTDVRLENNELNSNQSSGLSVWEDAKVQIVKSTAEFNNDEGIYASDQAFVTVEQSKLLFNTTSGISFNKSATGSVVKNTIISNKFGIEIMAQSSVSVAQNIFSLQTEAIYIAKKASATIGQNTFKKNGQDVVHEK